MRSIPNTSHEAWIVDDYQRGNDDSPTRIAPAVFRLVADWVSEQIRTSGAAPSPEPHVDPGEESR